jgi:Carboxypeptidase regulatory-like domain/TonB dependent receptor-like, beta-barrel
MKRASWGVGPAVLALLLLAPPTRGQAIYGEVTGTVTDPTGAALPKAAVTAVCSTTQQSRKVVTGPAGTYRLSSLPPCTYKLSVSATGFKTAVSAAYVEVGITIKQDFTLQVGQRAETVTVEAATPLVDYSAGVNNEVDTKSILDLPTEGRDFKSILALTPGVQRTPGGGFLDVSISGQRTTTNNYMIDGMPNNDRFYGSEVVGQPGVLGIPASVLGNDSISEYTVQELPTAENGVKGGAAINVTLKSGTNDFHGDAFYFGDYDWLNAKNFFSSTTTPYHNHNYGGTIGGPIIKNRTFFFASFEGQRNKALEPYAVTVPTQGDVNAAQAMINDPTINVNALPINSAGQALLKYYPIDPSLTPGGSTLTVALPNTDTMSSFIIKIDHKMNEKMSFSARYLFADSLQSAPLGGYTLPPAPGSGLAPDAFNSVAPTRTQLAGASWTYTISPNKILDVRFNWSRYSQILGPNNKVDPLSLGIDTGPLNPADFGVPPVYASSVTAANPGGIVGYPLSTRPTQTYDTSVHYTWIHGAHTFKFGGNYQYASTFSLRNRARSEIDSNAPDFTTLITQLLLGRMDKAARSFGDTARHLYQPSMGLFFQDEWKVTPRVTVSYGLRWDINGALGDADKIASNFFPCAPPEPNVCAPKGFPNGLVREQVGFSRLYNLDLKDFGPRAGLAWDIFGNGKTALRIGYAMTYDVANFAAISAPYLFQAARAGAFTNSNLGVFSVTALGGAGSQLAQGNITVPQYQNALFEAFTPDTCYDPATNTGAVNPITGVAGPDFVCIGPQAGSPNPAVPFQTYGPNPTGTPPFNIFGTIPDLKTPRIQYYSVTLQHEIFRNNVITISYLGTHGTDSYLMRSLNNRPIGCFSSTLINPATMQPYGQFTGGPMTAKNPSTLNCNRPFDTLFQLNGAPNFEYVMQLTNDGYLRYNALQVGYRQRDWHGFNSQYNFTWSNCIDTNSVNRGGGATVPIAENPYNPASNQGPCDTDVRLNFTSGVTYDFPKWSAAGRFGEGWQVGSVVTALTGRPWTPLLSSSADNSGQDLVYQRPDCFAKPTYQFSDPNSFTVTNFAAVFGPNGPSAADGTLGTCGRNSFRGPKFVQWDMNLNKTTKITERISLQLRWEIFNVLNHPNFYSFPASSRATSGIFSTYSQTPDIAAGNPFLSQGGPRAMQIGAKIIF